MDVEKSIAFSKTALTKYIEKLTQLNDLKNKLTCTSFMIKKQKIKFKKVKFMLNLLIRQDKENS